jgi:hypothetical protein
LVIAPNIFQCGCFYFSRAGFWSDGRRKPEAIAATAWRSHYFWIAVIRAQSQDLLTFGSSKQITREKLSPASGAV